MQSLNITIKEFKMNDVKNKLNSQEKALLISKSDASFGDSVRSMRNKMINEGYLTSTTQVASFDKIMLTVRSNENNTLHKMLFDNLVSQKQLHFINNIKDLFKEGWMLSKAFRFYTGGMPISEINDWKMKQLMSIIDKKNKTDFEKIGIIENVKSSKDTKQYKTKSKAYIPKAKPVLASSIPVIIKKAT